MAKRIAICFSGHIRSCGPCIPGFISKIIKPLRDDNYFVDIFGHFWNVTGHRRSGWIGMPDFQNFNKLHPVRLTTELFNRSHFTSKYGSDQWMQRPQMQCSTTSGDATSMHYMIKRSFEEVLSYQIENGVTYDLFIRIRPDLLLSVDINLDEIKDAIDNEVLYVPEWHGKYPEVTMKLMDQFAFGNYNMMKEYSSTFDNIPRYLLRNDIVHTAEGFLNQNILYLSTKTTSMKYQLQRNGYVDDLWN